MDETGYIEQMNDFNEQVMYYLSYIGIQILFLINIIHI